MPPKRVTKAPEPTDRVTRHSATKPNPNATDSEERPSSKSSSTSTVVPFGASRRSDTSHWSDLDSSQSDFNGFESGVDTASTQNVQRLLQGVQIPEAVEQVESPTENETQFFGTANESSLEMAESDDEGDVPPQNLAPVAAPIPVIAGITPEMQAFFKCNRFSTNKLRRRSKMRSCKPKRQLRDAKSSSDDKTKIVKLPSNVPCVSISRYSCGQTKRR